LSSYYSALVKVELEYELNGTVYPFSWADFTEGADFTTSFAYNSFYNEPGGVTRLIADANGGTIAIARSADRRRVSVSVLDLTKAVNNPLRMLRFRNVKLNGIPCELTLDKSAIDQVVAENTSQAASITALQSLLLPGLDSLQTRQIQEYRRGAGTAAGNVLGIVASTAGNSGSISHHTMTAADSIGRTIWTPAATAGAANGFRTSTDLYFRDHGFGCSMQGTWVNAAANQFQMGWRSLAATILAVEPSAVAAAGYWIGFDTTDTNLQLMHKNTSGPVTKIDLGIAKTAPAVLRLDIYCPVGGLPKIRVTKVGKTPVLVHESTPSVNIPDLVTGLGIVCQMRSSATTPGGAALSFVSGWKPY
jgi:hypothetical protein